MSAHILVVDDSSFARRTLRRILEEAGNSVEEARDGSEALERYFLRRPDVVLLDLVMEGMNGMEVLKKLREMDPGARVIVATADIQDMTRVEAGEGGARAFLTKPYDREKVLGAISEVLAGEAR